MSFLDGLGQGLHRLFGGNNLAMAQALLAGDYRNAAAIGARAEELQRQQGRRDAQVRAAKELGIGGEISDAFNTDDLSMLARRLYAAKMFGPGGEGVPDAPVDDGAMQPANEARPYAPPPGRFPAGPAFTQASDRYQGGPGFTGSAGPRTLAAGAPRSSPIPPLGSIARARTYADASALPNGAYFFAPNGSLRRIV